MMSNYMRTAMLNALRGTSFSVSQLYLGLFIQPPTAAGGGVEPNDGYYERQAVSLGTPGTEGDAQVAKNSGSFSFPAFSSWGKVTHFGFFDAKTGGNLLLFGELNTAVTVHKGDVLMNYSGMLEAAMR